MTFQRPVTLKTVTGRFFSESVAHDGQRIARQRRSGCLSLVARSYLHWRDRPIIATIHNAAWIRERIIAGRLFIIMSGWCVLVELG
jgi:hypothetical protein